MAVRLSHDNSYTEAMPVSCDAVADVHYLVQHMPQLGRNNACVVGCGCHSMKGAGLSDGSD